MGSGGLTPLQAARSPPRWQGRSVRDGTLRRAQRRSFTPASFLEEDTADFPDELDTSFFARVRDGLSAEASAVLRLCLSR